MPENSGTKRRNYHLIIQNQNSMSLFYKVMKELVKLFVHQIHRLINCFLNTFDVLLPKLTLPDHTAHHFGIRKPIKQNTTNFFLKNRYFFIIRFIHRTLFNNPSTSLYLKDTLRKKNLQY